MTWHYMTQYDMIQSDMKQQDMSKFDTIWHSTTQHSTAQNSTEQHSTEQLRIARFFNGYNDVGTYTGCNVCWNEISIGSNIYLEQHYYCQFFRHVSNIEYVTTRVRWVTLTNFSLLSLDSNVSQHKHMLRSTVSKQYHFHFLCLR